MGHDGFGSLSKGLSGGGASPFQSGGGDLAILGLLMGGPLLLLRGWHYRRAQTRLAAIADYSLRSAVAGQVRLCGRAMPRTELRTPISDKLCCWWYCEVQELFDSPSGVNWHTVKELGSPEMFYLEDATGRVLVDPHGGEFCVPINDVRDRRLLEPILSSWGINTEKWFDSRRIRVVEYAIFPGCPLYVAGELVARRQHMEDRKDKLAEHMRAFKTEMQELVAAAQEGGDKAEIEEWAALRLREEALFLWEEAARNPAASEGCDRLVRCPAGRRFTISEGHESGTVCAMRTQSRMSFLCGAVLTAAGIFLAEKMGYRTGIELGALAAGAVLGAAVYQFRDF